MSQWYYEYNGQRVGPIDEAALRTLASSGAVQSDTLVWTAGMGDWAPFCTTLGLAPTTSAPQPRIALGPYQEVSDLGKWTVLMFRVAAGFSAVTALAYFGALNQGNWSTLWAIASGESRGRLETAILLQILATVALFCFWLYRSTQNLALIRAGQIEASPTWAVASFFVPVVNLWAPQKGLKQLYQGVTGRVDGQVNTWWGLFIASLVTSIAGLGMLQEAIKAGISDDIYGAGLMLIISEGLFIAAALVGANCIQAITTAMTSSARQGGYAAG